MELVNLEWHTEQRKVKDLFPYERNPRVLNEKKTERLKKSLKKFNLAEIPAIDIDNKICAGHQRINILRVLNQDDRVIDVRVPNRKLTEEEFKEYNIGSNLWGGDWDLDALANDFEIDELRDLGFEDVQIDSIIGLDLKREEDEKELTKIRQVIIDCSDEVDQKKIYDDLTKMGYKCQLSIL